MDIEAKVIQAVQNNTRWCDALCRSHQAPGEFHEAYWINHGEVPPYTSKLIARAGSEHAALQLSAIRSLLVSEPESRFSVKDGFQCLDLEPLGSSVLFDATWIYWTPSSTLPDDPAEVLEWSVVEDPSALARWELAWRGSHANAAVVGAPTVFGASLLLEPGLHFLAGKLGATVVASAALNRTGDVVGLSNVFSGLEGVGPMFPGCVRLAQNLYPGIPIVGYERGADLVQAKNAGFAGIHGLTVWQRTIR